MELHDDNKGTYIKYGCDKYYIFHNYGRQTLFFSVSYFYEFHQFVLF